MIESERAKERKIEFVYLPDYQCLFIMAWLELALDEKKAWKTAKQDWDLNQYPISTFPLKSDLCLLTQAALLSSPTSH